MICNHLCSTFPCCNLCCACLRITSSQSRPRSSKIVICSKQSCHFLLTLHRSTCTSKAEKRLNMAEVWESGDFFTTSKVAIDQRKTCTSYPSPETWNAMVQALFPKPHRTEKPHGFENIFWRFDCHNLGESCHTVPTWTNMYLCNEYIYMYIMYRYQTNYIYIIKIKTAWHYIITVIYRNRIII